MTLHQAIAENLPWLPGSVADKAAKLGVHKSTLFAWLAEAEGRARGLEFRDGPVLA